MAQLDAVAATGAPHRPMMHGEDHGVSLSKWYNFRARLHARPLFREHELAAREVPSRRRKEERGLQREDVLAVEVLVQAVVVPRFVLQEKRRRPGLPGAMAAIEKSRMIVRIADHDLHDLIPSVRDERKLRVERG